MDNTWVGVVGVAVGAVASYPFQTLHARRSDSHARAQALRAERVAAYSAFAEKIMDWRRSQIARTVSIEALVGSVEVAAVKDENRRVRTAAWTALYRVQLLCDDPDIEKLAHQVIQVTRNMKRAPDRHTADQMGDAVRRALELFLRAASQQTTR